ncbi:MAG: carboxypeptidase regulatory-like domain-containing protein [Candidatus Methanomethylicus sp.]|nr:carboxypeptidase regulatory-like domain-containing protein [Candidatus Methanomethylicus sp.]
MLNQTIAKKMIILLPLFLVLSVTILPVNAIAPIYQATVRVNGPNGEAQVLTGSDGTFLINGSLGEGNYTVEIIAGGYVFGKFENVRITAGETTDMGDILLTNSGLIQGRSIGPNGEPIRNYPITLAYQPTNWSFSGTTTQTDGTFIFSTGIDNGTYWIEIQPQWKTYITSGGYLANRTYGIQAIAGQSTSDVILQLGYSACISGFAKFINGTPYAYKYVSAYWNNNTFYNYAITDANGFYNLSNCLPTGSYKLVLSASNIGAKPEETIRYVDATEGQEITGVNFTVTPSAILSGKVTYPNGYPVPSIMVYARMLNDTISCVGYADNYGNYRITSYLYNGTYTISPYDYLYVNQNVTLTETMETSGVNFIVPFNGSTAAFIEGRIVDNYGNPVAYATIASESYSTQSDGDGKYQLVVKLPQDVFSSDINVTATKKAFNVTTLSSVHVDSNSTTPLNITLNWIPTGILKGRIVNSGAPPRQSSAITIQSPSANVTAGSTVTLSGQLSQAINGTISIYKSYNGSAYGLVTNTTMTSGAYSAQTTLSLPGDYSFYCSWDGNDAYFGSASNTITLTAQQESGNQPVTADNNLLMMGGIAAVAVVGLVAVVVLMMRKKK